MVRLNKKNYRCFYCNSLIILLNTYAKDIFLFSNKKIKLTTIVENVAIAPTILDKNNCVPKYYLEISEKFKLFEVFEDLVCDLIFDDEKILSKITTQNIDQKIKTILTLS
jgi:hypothetical protein